MLKSIPLRLMRVTKPVGKASGVFNPALTHCGFMSFCAPLHLVLPAKEFCIVSGLSYCRLHHLSLGFDKMHLSEQVETLN